MSPKMAGASGQVQSGLTLTLRNELSEIRRLAAALEEFADAAAIPPKAAMRMTLVLDELLTNTISYGYPDARSGEIHVAATLRGDRLEIAVSDDGVPFDPQRQAEPDLDAALEDRPIGGLGLHLINTMAQVSYSRDGTRNLVTLTLPVEHAAADGSGATE